jgi:putative protease
MSHWTPELLSPAGSLEKLKVSVLYGADAVYLGGQKFGLRQASDNFTYEELTEGVEFAHTRGSKVYVVLNSFLHDKDLAELPEFLGLLEELKVDAVIVSDLGVIATLQKHSKLVVHLSTQASCLNIESAKLWQKMGAQRIVLGREVTIKEAAKIKKATGLEIEMFVHGSMCMSYSGNCVISNYTQGRDSNRGGCAHSCRFEYSIDFKNESEESKKAYFMSSKDLEGIRMLPEFIEAGIDSLKVEGRNKSHHYAGTISKVYADALRYYQTHGNFLSTDMLVWEEELRKVSHRDYTTGSLDEYAGVDSIYNHREQDDNEFVVSGIVLEASVGQHLLVDVKSAFHPGDI